ncbi:MAG: C cytochrome precursor [Planctomycetaceae bacterium]|nr:C cytochrome precursor [Planctomycetaceae bacterium]
MTQVATPETVFGEFDGRELVWPGGSCRVFRRQDQFWIDMDDPDEALTGEKRRIERPVVMVTGSHHMQVYWYPIGKERSLGQVPVVYLKTERKWIPRNAAFMMPPDMGSFPETSRWNATCLWCHTTQGRTRPVNGFNGPLQLTGMDSQAAEFGIACEACHGPGERHVRYQTGKLPERTSDPIVDPESISHQRSSQICGQCHGLTVSHSRKHLEMEAMDGSSYRPGDELSVSRWVVRYDQQTKQHLEEFGAGIAMLTDSFWTDGMVRVSGREFTGLMETRCYTEGQMSCLSCHTMHPPEDSTRPLNEWADDQLKEGMDQDKACLQCHQEPDYTSRNHTHHGSQSTGSRCYNCHSPHTAFGLLKAIRSHQVSSPTVAESTMTGRPNACNLCHLDKTLQWTADQLKSWYAIESPPLDDEQRTISAAVLWAIRGDAGQRALAAWHMGWRPAQQVSGTAWMAPFLGNLLADPYAAVRFVAYRSLRGLPRYQSLDYDFVGSADTWPEAVKRVSEIWEEQLQERAVFSRELLMTPNGRLDGAIFERLKKMRDDTPIHLAE